MQSSHQILCTAKLTFRIQGELVLKAIEISCKSSSETTSSKIHAGSFCESVRLL